MEKKETDVRARILENVMSLELSKGHLKWAITDLARLADVSRPLIYYHFGKSKRDILFECLDVFAEEYLGLTEERTNMLKQGKLLESMTLTRQMFLRNPAIAVFYQKWRMQTSPLQKKLIEIEKRYQAKLKSAFPQMTSNQILAVHGLFHGLISAPFVTSGALEDGAKFVETLLWGSAVGKST